MNIFFDLYLSFIEKIEEQYPIPNSKAFQERRFENVKWSKPEYRNFFTIIKILAERGPSTIDEIVENDGMSQKFKKDSRYITYRRLILGDKKAHVKGLIEKEAVVASKTGDKLHKKYELSYYGIMYAIKLFMDPEIIFSGNYRNMLKWDPKVGWYDYSKQTKFPITIIDILAKNYTDRIPLIFGKWKYLKENPRVDVYLLFYLANIRRGSKILMNDLISANCKYSITFNTFPGDIALGFFTKQMESVYYPFEHFLKSIDDKEILDFIDKIFYSYERLFRDSFYRSQAHYFLYKGQKEKAAKYYVKAINANDMLTPEEKNNYKKKANAKDIANFGIQFCK